MKGDRTYLISVETEQKCLMAETTTESLKHLQLLFSLCRMIDDRGINCFVRIGAPDYVERILKEKEIKRIAEAARAAGIGSTKGRFL